MKIKIIQDTLVQGKHAAAGESLTVDDKTGSELVSIGRAQKDEQDQEPKNAQEATETAHIVPKDQAAGPAENASADPAKLRKEVTSPENRESR